MNTLVLALDLERTLVTNALHAIPRPGLREFLEFCHNRFDRVVLFTTVEETDAREVFDELHVRGYVPTELHARLEYVDWHGEYKDLHFVPDAVPADILLVDDDGGWVRPDQSEQWVPIAPFDGEPDRELSRVQAVLLTRLTERPHGE